MKSLSITQAQNELPKLVTDVEPLVLTDGTKPMAVLIQIGHSPSRLEVGGETMRLDDILSDASIKGIMVESDSDKYLLQVVENALVSPSTVVKRDWWSKLQEIDAGQKQRGFVGTVADVDRGDEGYDERMSEIYKNTLPKNGKH